MKKIFLRILIVVSCIVAILLFTSCHKSDCYTCKYKDADVAYLMTGDRDVTFTLCDVDKEEMREYEDDNDMKCK